VRPALKDQLGTRIELRLGDPADSELGRKAAALVPQGRPGRGMTREGLHLLTALPRIDGSSNPADLSPAMSDAVARIADRSQGRAPEVRLLPEHLARSELLALAGGWPSGLDSRTLNERLPIGLSEAELAPAHIDFAEQPHFMVFGDSECGKTTVLRGIAESIMAANTPRNAKIIVGDYRRTMLGVVETDHLAAYAPSTQMLGVNLADLAAVLATRLPRADVSQQQLRERSWWSGPEIFVLIDDYDLVATSSGNPVAALVEYLPQAKDIGFHLVLARRSGGAGRALFEPVMARMRDVSPAGLVMSGSKDEGNLVGAVRPSPQPPGRGVLVNRRGTALVQIAEAGAR
jgi:S-DNA-T family DNA segregation ATPase FtsK/SpoIIIE